MTLTNTKGLWSPTLSLTMLLHILQHHDYISGLFQNFQDLSWLQLARQKDIIAKNYNNFWKLRLNSANLVQISKETVNKVGNYFWKAPFKAGQQEAFD